MASVFDTARYILECTGTISAWKLQKLCYYSQAWSMAWTGKPMFPEEFQAWRNGPVCPALYNRHRGQFIVRPDDIPGDPSALSEDEQDSVNTVLAHYGSWEPYQLREQTHSEDPWKNARGGIPENANCSTVITVESMGEYYGSL